MILILSPLGYFESSIFRNSMYGNLFCCVNDKDIYALEQIPDHEEKSKELDADYQKPKENSPELTGLMFHLFGDIFKNA